MKLIHQIEFKINMVKVNSIKPLAIIINPKIEREIFIKYELEKSQSLETHFNLPIIVTNQIETFAVAV